MKRPYRDQLKLPQWQKRRLQRLDAAGWKCEECGDANSPLHVHHKQYVRGRAPWEYSDNELSVLCEDCHAKEHGRHARRPMRQPVDRIAWMLLLESGWWVDISASDRAVLCSQPGWHGDLFRFINQHPTWTRQVPIRSTWAASAFELLDEDPSIEPLADDLPRAIEQFRSQLYPGRV